MTTAYWKGHLDKAVAYIVELLGQKHSYDWGVKNDCWIALSVHEFYCFIFFFILSMIYYKEWEKLQCIG